MTSYIIQSALLVLGAYFLGAWIGCACRRILTGRAVEAAAPAEPAVVAGSAATLAAADRFGRALTGEGLAARPVSEPIPLPETYEPAAPRIETIADRPAPTPPQPPRSVSPDAIEVVATAVTPDGGVSAQIATTDAPAEDDLALIRGVDAHAADVLRRQGLGSYARIAAMTADEVDRIEGLLDQDGRIGRENWIEQAAMLAAGGATRFSREAKGEAPQPVSQHPPASETGLPEATAPETVEPETVELETTDPETSEPETAPPEPSTAEPSTESEALKAAASAAAAAAVSEANEPAEVEPEPEPAAPSAVAGEPPVAAEPAPELSSVAAIDVRDDLTRIDGINHEVQTILNQREIMQISQIAGWSADDVSKVESFLGNSGRVTREDWIGQARAILGLPPIVSASPVVSEEVSSDAHPPSAEPSPSPAIDEPPAAGGYRETAIGHAGQIGAVAQGDDLKRIRGIGVLIEKKLKSLGVTSYQQIANWTRADIDRISDYLDFRGRIERENWVEQARILLAGGETHFSRRFDQSRTGPLFASNDD